MDKTEETFAELDKLKRKASISQIGGFRPPEDRITSWFGGPGVGLPGEALPQYQSKDMFCLLQVKVSEAPYQPPELEGTEFLVVFVNRLAPPSVKYYGQEWLIREYSSLDRLQLLPASHEPEVVKNFPLRWRLVDDDYPNLHIAQELARVHFFNPNPFAADELPGGFPQYHNTKFGGYPCCNENPGKLTDYVFQISHEDKADWMWSGGAEIAYFYKSECEKWRLELQYH